MCRRDSCAVEFRDLRSALWQEEQRSAGKAATRVVTSTCSADELPNLELGVVVADFMELSGLRGYSRG
jgi:hypothetical protein